MTSVKRFFIKVIPVSPEAAQEPAVVAWITASLVEPWDVRGPRGGRYVADGPISPIEQRPAVDVGDGFLRNDRNILFRATRTGRYIRPPRRRTA